MKIKNIMLGGLLAGGLILSGYALAQGPVVNIDGHRHPNLAGYHVIGDETAKYLAKLLREKK